MKFTNFLIPFFFFFLFFNLIFSQEESPTFIAKKGEGIVEVLYREGLDENVYYQKFLALNKGKISKGSMLFYGEIYKIPVSETSYRNSGRNINLSTNEERPIFDPNQLSLRKKDSVLQNSVYYLLFDKFSNENLKLVKENTNNRNTYALAIAKKLLEKGAKVYLFDYNDDVVTNLGDYVRAINKRYLKHQNKFQRLLIIDVDNGFNASASIEILHHQKSDEGKKFAEHLEQIFKSKKIKLSSTTNGATLTEKTDLYLANNVLPAVTFVKVNRLKNKSVVTNDKNKFVNLITTGIQVDYSKIDLEGQE